MLTRKSRDEFERPQHTEGSQGFDVQHLFFGDQWKTDANRPARHNTGEVKARFHLTPEFKPTGKIANLAGTH